MKQKASPILIFLDTCVLCRDFSLQGRKLRILADRVATLNARLVLSSIVVDELVNRYSQEIAEKVKAVKSSLRGLRSKVWDTSLLPHVDLDSLADVERYRRYVTDWLESKNALIVQLPQVPHADIIDRDLARQRPFQDSGAGYRDYLIWRTFLSEAEEFDGEALFVSANTKDFFDNGDLHKHLASDLRSLGIAERVRAFPSLEALIDEYLQPRVDATKTLAQRLEEDREPGIPLRAYLSREILSALNRSDLSKELLDLPSGTGTIEIEQITTFGSPRAIDTYKFDQCLIEITGSLDLKIVASMQFSWMEYYQTPGVPDLFEDPDEDTPPKFEVRDTRDIEVSFSVIWDSEEHQLYGLDIVQIF
jgi:hypothetical protein